MKQKQDIPTHHYDDVSDKIRSARGNLQGSEVARMPFALTHFEIMDRDSQAEYSHRHDCYEILFLYEGAGEHVIDFEIHSIRAPMVYFLSKDQVHFWQLTKALKGFALLVPEEFLGFPSSNIIRGHDFAFFHHVGKTPYISIADEDLSGIKGLLQEMDDEFMDANAQSPTVMRAYLHILLTKLHRMYDLQHPDEHSSTTTSMVRQFKQLVSEHFLTEHSVQDYADRMGVSSSHLRDTVKIVTGNSPGSIIRQRLILEAKRLLAHGDTTVSEIGYHLNFDDASYFGRFFKRETGMSPAAFRGNFLETYRIVSE